jgi:aldehyde dehydrogenase
VTGKPFCEVAAPPPRTSSAPSTPRTPQKPRGARPPHRARERSLNQDRRRDGGQPRALALSESWDNGKPVRETLAADLPLAIDHFRYFAGCLRAEEGSIAELDDNTVAYHVKEPLGVVGQIIPWNFPLLMAAWKLAPALAAGNCVVLKPAEQTPVDDPAVGRARRRPAAPGVLNIVNGFGIEAGKPLASPRVAKVAFTGETTTGRLIMQYASENLIPVTLELGGKSPEHLLRRRARADDDFRRRRSRASRCSRSTRARSAPARRAR